MRKVEEIFSMGMLFTDQPIVALRKYGVVCIKANGTGKQLECGTNNIASPTSPL